ncbi:hypothetical protein RRG08_065771 [Elysia crispata]|uniref:Uncharacterized protein n=1 Tax=Elysia crispata TaxID=231223 RepID=A0AAE0Y674_9GAST|nr:hypothetical protein RRG08_065771 [Elysia crispata]
MAQWVERRLHNPQASGQDCQVPGSNLIWLSLYSLYQESCSPSVSNVNKTSRSLDLNLSLNLLTLDRVVWQFQQSEFCSLDSRRVFTCTVTREWHDVGHRIHQFSEQAVHSYLLFFMSINICYLGQGSSQIIN